MRSSRFQRLDEGRYRGCWFYPVGLLAAAAALTILIVTATSPRATALRGRAPAPHGVVRSSLRTRGVEITPAPWPSANSAQLQTGLSFEHRPGYVEPRALLQPQPATPKVCPQLTQRPPAVPRGDAACNLLTHRDGPGGVSECRVKHAKQLALDFCKQVQTEGPGHPDSAGDIPPLYGFKRVVVRLPTTIAKPPRHSSFIIAIADQGDIVSHVIASGGQWEPFTTAELVRQLHGVRDSGLDTALLDVGANLGWYTFVAAAHGFPGIAFEAMARNQAAMWTTMCLNPWMHDLVTLFPYGLGEADLQCNMWSDDNNVLDGHLVCDEAGEAQAVSRCLTPHGPTHIVRLDDYLPPTPHDLVMKIDVEGSEPGVMRGAGDGAATVIGERVHFATTEVNPGDLVGKGSSVAGYLEMWTRVGFAMSLVQMTGFAEVQTADVERAVVGRLGDVYMANSRWPRVPPPASLDSLVSQQVAQKARQGRL